jgi:hypothetical protein
MKEKDYNQLLTSVSGVLAPINQLLYEILVIIAIYIFLDHVQTSSLYLSKNSSLVIILFALLALVLDWFIWNNSVQTFLFAAILVIYIRYNINNSQLVAGFVNMTGSMYSQPIPETNSSTIDCNQLKIPELVDLPYDTTPVSSNGIMAYDKSADSTLNSIHDAYANAYSYAYKAGQSPATITDSQYARIMLDELYNTPQYRNNHPPNEIDASLANNIHQSTPSLSTTPSTTPSLEASTSSIVKAGNMSDEELLESFRHPKNQFLDNRWLTMPGIGTYNDNTCSTTTPKRKDAICNLVPFGKKLEQCTNQEYSVSIDQLDKISNNEIPNHEF